MNLPQHHTNARAGKLAKRKSMLITECALQRVTLVAQYRSLGQVTSWVSIGRNFAGILKQRQEWKSVLLTSLVSLLPARTFSMFRNALLFWQIWRTIFPKHKE